MIKVYDTTGEFLMMIDKSLKDVIVTEELSTGQKSLCFKVPCLIDYIEAMNEENYVKTADYDYVIKEVNIEDNKYIQVYCVANIEDIKGKVFRVFDCFDKNIKQGYEYCIGGLTDWSVVYNSIDNSVITYQEPNVTAYDMIMRIAEEYGQEVWFDTKNKKIRIYDRIGKEFGVYCSNELRLKQLKKQSSTYEYATVLYPIGKDGLTVASINNGHEYITNFDYTNKYIEAIWEKDEIEVAEELLKQAEFHLNEIAQPRASYKLYLSDLGDVQIGDTIRIVDNIKKIKQDQRVVKIKRNLKAPEKSTVEISNIQIDFADLFVKNQKQQANDIKFIKKVIKNMQGTNEE